MSDLKVSSDVQRALDTANEASQDIKVHIAECLVMRAHIIEKFAGIAEKQVLFEKRVGEAFEKMGSKIDKALWAVLVMLVAVVGWMLAHGTFLNVSHS